MNEPKPQTPLTDALLDLRGNKRILPNDHNLTGWSSEDCYAFIDHARSLEIKLQEAERQRDEVRQQIKDAGDKLTDIPIGNEHETYSLSKRCEIAITVKQYAWKEMDEKRAERDQLIKVVDAYHQAWNGYKVFPSLANERQFADAETAYSLLPHVQAKKGK
jgi:hypothetical protein